MQSILEIVSILLAVVSATLAIVALVFSWVSFRETSKIQREIHAMLARVAEKLDVVSERTGSQMDKAWDLLVRSVGSPLPQEDKRLIEERGKRTIQTAVDQIMAKVHISREAADADKAAKHLGEEIGKALRTTAEEMTSLSQMETLSREIEDIGSLLRRLISAFMAVPPRAEGMEALVDSAEFLLNDRAATAIRELLRFRNRVVHETGARPSEFDEQLARAAQVKGYLASYVAEAARPGS